MFDNIEVAHFGQTETEYKDWAIDRLQKSHTTTVTYTGDNNVTYEKTFEPNQSDISFQAITPIYLPKVRQTTHLQQYSYSYEYYAAGPSRITLTDEIRRCVHCEETAAEEYTYCPNCGSINCRSHIETERWEGTPVCTGCAVTARFALKTKYFYDKTNLEEFRQEYEQMPFYEKAMENIPLASGVFITLLFLFVVILMFTVP